MPLLPMHHALRIISRTRGRARAIVPELIASCLDDGATWDQLAAALRMPTDEARRLYEMRVSRLRAAERRPTEAARAARSYS